MEQNSLLQRIADSSGKSAEEINSLIEAKKAKFSGLLTDAGAIFMVSKELGISIEKPAEKPEEINCKIGNLQEGQAGANIECRISHVFSPKKFEKNGRKGMLCNLLVNDASGQIRVTLWNDDARELFEKGIERGDTIKLNNCNVSKFNEKLQLTLYNGKLELMEQGKNEKKKIKEMKPGLIDVDVLLKIDRIFEEKEFVSGEKKGKLVSFIASDKSGSIRGTVWNELTEVMKKITPGKTVLIEGAYTKEGLNGTELHLGWQSRILLNPRESTEFNELQELNKLKRKRFDEIIEGDVFEQRAAIVDLLKGNYFYLACPSCGKKAAQGEQGFECINCGKTEPKAKAILSLIVDDGFKAMKCGFFGKDAEKILEKNAKELEEMNEAQKNEFTELKKHELIGKEIILQARAKKNEQAMEMELSATGIEKIDEIKEAKEMIKALAK